MYQPRIYRDKTAGTRWSSFRLSVKETDLWIGLDRAVDYQSMQPEILNFIIDLRYQLEEYIHKNPEFRSSFSPLPYYKKAPLIVRKMLRAGAAAGVGPMAGVAGAFAEAVGQFIINHFGVKSIIVENGGDLWLKASEPVTILIDAGSSSLSNRLALEFEPAETPVSICTSSGTAGHSTSLGKTNASVAISFEGAIADAYATAIGNMFKTLDDLNRIDDLVKIDNFLTGAVVIMEDRVALKGKLKLKIVKADANTL